MRKRYSQIEGEQALKINGDIKITIPKLLHKQVLEYVEKLRREFGSHLIDGVSGLVYKPEYYVDDQGCVHYSQDVKDKKSKFDQSISQLGLELTNLENCKSGYGRVQTRSFYMTLPVKDYLERAGELEKVKSSINITEEVL